METAALHDHAEVTALVLKHREVLQRIAVDQDEVGEGAGLERPELAFLAQHLGPDRRRRADDLDWRNRLPAQHELAALINLERAEEIAAVGHWYPGALADLERAQAAVDDEVVLGKHVGGHA